ncbi:MAG TPA: hypothetical protein VG497_12750 [Kribbella sp.]|nr:hypothetical protein [Kribbella sp.]
MHAGVEQVRDPGEAVDPQGVLLQRRLAREPEQRLPANQVVCVPERRSRVLGGQEPAEVVDAEQGGEQRDLPCDSPDAAPVPAQFRQLRLPHPLQRRLRHAAPKLKPNVRSFQIIAMC